MSSSQEMDIVYTIVDEAPELASGSLLPIIKAFTSSADIRAVSYTHLTLPTIVEV